MRGSVFLLIAFLACSFLPLRAFSFEPNVVYVDSSFHQYGFWTNNQDPIKGSGDTLVFCFRRWGDGTLGSGALGLAVSTDRGQTWSVDWAFNNGLHNDPQPESWYSRYPTACLQPGYCFGGTWPETSTCGWIAFGVYWDFAWSGGGTFGGFAGGVPDEIPAHKAWSWFDDVDSVLLVAAADEGDKVWISLGLFDSLFVPAGFTPGNSSCSENHSQIPVFIANDSQLPYNPLTTRGLQTYN
jgi:hypothetical protein